ncbi:MAG: DNA polymerase III subunit delta [Nitrososphaerales archaeon]
MIVLIHGPVELLRAEALAEAARTCGDDPELVELNTTRLDGGIVAPAELENACDTLPFLAERRLIVVNGLLARLAAPPKGKAKPAETVVGSSGAPPDKANEDETPRPEVLKGQAKAFLAYLEQVPDSTVLVLLEEELAAGHGLRKLQELSRDGRARIVTCEKLRRSDLPTWIRNRAQMRKVTLDGPALMDLAECVGDELRQLDQELIKLGDYAHGRTVTREDVRKLVPSTRVASVFDLVDALGAGNGPLAGRLMTHALDVDGEPPLRLLAVIARHYRQLLRLKAMQAQGIKGTEIARALGIFEWKMAGMISQANRHSFARLEGALELILQADESIKTGKLTDREAMDVLLAGLMQA